MTNSQPGPASRFLYEPYERFYDNIRFIHKPAERLIEHARLKAGQRILDVACGTGLATMAAAKVVGETGKVIGIDIGSNWLEVAKEKAAATGQSNIDYRIGDAVSLEFNDNFFDAVICASSIFYFKEIPKALREWRRVLKTGGTVAFTGFGEKFWQPVLHPLGKCLSKFDNLPPPVPFFTERTNTPEKCRELMKTAGFEKSDIITEKMDCTYPDTGVYWQEIALSFIGLRLARLSSSDLEKFKTEHLSEMESMYKDKPISIEFPVHICLAKKRR
jgi:ubiquinone/menaquinone biosynthesis C-methylase UbiE